MARIISGIARGRNLAVPEDGTRPTADRAKEGLFSSLAARFGFEGRHVLDLFAGTGALGLEALSRGAASTTFVEADKAACRVIEKNIAAAKLPGTRVEQMKASSFVAVAPRGHYGMVLADPPYDLADSAVAEMIDALVPLLAPGAAVVIERHRDTAHTEWPEGFEPTPQKLKKRTFGIARMDMATFIGEGEK